MARMRTLKPESAASSTLEQIPRAMRWTFAMLWTHCDDEGRALWNTRLVKAAIYPLDDDMTPDAVNAELLNLLRVGAICRYEAVSKVYLHIPTWHEHQHPNRPQPSKLPPCPRTDHTPTAHAHVTEPSVNEHGVLIPVVVVVEESSSRGEEVNPSSAAARADVERVCTHLADCIEGNGSKRPRITDRWRRSARLMLDADHHTEQQITAAIDWCQNDEFWRGNVLSMPKLREKYDQLRLVAQRPNGRASPANGQPSTTEQRVGAALARAAQHDRLEISG